MTIQEVSSWYDERLDSERLFDPLAGNPIAYYDVPEVVMAEPEFKEGIDLLREQKPTVKIMLAKHTCAEDLGLLKDQTFERAVGRAGLYGFESNGDRLELMEWVRKIGSIACGDSFEEYAADFNQRLGLGETETFDARVMKARATLETPSYLCDVVADGTQLEKDLLKFQEAWKNADFPDRERGYIAYTNVRGWVMVARSGLALSGIPPDVKEPWLRYI